MHRFISAEVHVLIVECLVDEAHHLFHHLPGEIDGGVELTHIDAIAVQSDVFVFLAAAPRSCVGGSVDFRDDPNGTVTSILNDADDVFR